MSTNQLLKYYCSFTSIAVAALKIIKNSSRLQMQLSCYAFFFTARCYNLEVKSLPSIVYKQYNLYVRLHL